MFIFLSVHRAAEGVVICLGGGEGHVCIPLPCKEHLSENADILQYLQFWAKLRVFRLFNYLVLLLYWNLFGAELVLAFLIYLSCLLRLV
jgi:hypothetical protein